MPSFNCTVSGLSGVLRLDRYIADKLNLLTRSQVKSRHMRAKINGKHVKVSRPVVNGDILELSWEEAEPINIIPENIPLDILFENDRAVIINKPQGMVVHPGAGNWSGTLANALYYRKLEKKPGYCRETPGLRPGIAHRLDKETSGVMIAAYDDDALAFIAGQFKLRKAKKTYVAIVCGIPKELKGRIETPIARDPGNRKRFTVAAKGKPSLTLYSAIKTWPGYSLMLLRPKTGRTHQLRVHMKYIGHPIVGDPLYGTADSVFPGAQLMLHSKSLGITLPGDTDISLFKAPIPNRFKEVISCLNSRRR